MNNKNNHFVIYAETINFKIGSFIKIPPNTTDNAFVIHTEIENNSLFGIVTMIRDNGSLEGTLLNGNADYEEPSLMAVSPYSTNENINFMWSHNQTTNIDIKTLYPELMLM